MKKSQEKHDIMVLIKQEADTMKLKTAEEVTLEHQQEMMQKHKFVVHYVIDTYEFPLDDQLLSYPSIHTHGLTEHFNHPEIELALPLEEQTAMYLMHTFVDKLKAGVKVEETEIFTWPEYNHVRCYCLPVSYLQGQSVCQGYRLVIGDENNKLPGEAGCNRLYDAQIKAVRQAEDFPTDDESMVIS